MADSLLEKATSAISQAKETVTETAKTEVNVMKDAVDNVVTRGIDGAKSMLHNLEEKKDEVSSKILEAVSHLTDSAAATANSDLPVSTDNQPLLAAGDREAEPWWKICCGVLDILKASLSSTK
ncbi:hypothetical protein AALP_AA1G062900 [Arabis alpina]|uniref:Uncharacterized protein n=1 Tax=Arabis alpina TaxID=50452 RepID=A0A087HLG8_ARAAL|nr:hypothetical protein AALP_AA1G062900 [Arabis alpina]